MINGKGLWLCLILQVFTFSCASSNEFVLFVKGKVVPVIYITDKNLKSSANDFAALFKQATAQQLPLSTTEPQADEKVIEIGIDRQLKGFSIAQQGQKLQIKAESPAKLQQAFRYFFANFTVLDQYTQHALPSVQDKISLPLNLSFSSLQPFAYKEPYFAENFDANFRFWNNTQTLDEHWGLWGHNIGKFIKVTPAMYAQIGGETNEEQLNFSSEELYRALKERIALSLVDNPRATDFMIMPYDNALVCMCDRCVELGNTKNNASPAVFALINRLAKDYPGAQFFASAYLSTEQPPQEATKSNVGVMLSSMSFPKGVLLEHNKQAAEIINWIKAWKEKTEQIYLWDYAINFDNYFDFHPTVSIAQANLKFLYKQGIKGVFMHGSDEGGFVAFGDLKSYLYARLLNNLDIDLAQATDRFFSENYPELSKPLAQYYNTIEARALASNKKLDIYGGLKQSVNKYLNYYELNQLYNKISSLPSPLSSGLEKLKLACAFQLLELMRINGIRENGYLQNAANKQVKLAPTVQPLLNSLKLSASKLKIASYNESGMLMSDYLKQWEQRLLQPQNYNLLWDRKIKASSELDEDYTQTNMLNDGALGFRDYYNNWFINSSKSLQLLFNAEGLEGSRLMKFSFLYDTKHRILPPEQIEVLAGSKRFEVQVPKPSTDQGVQLVQVQLPITISNTNNVVIEFTKQKSVAAKMMALDEIYLE